MSIATSVNIHIEKTQNSKLSQVDLIIYPLVKLFLIICLCVILKMENGKRHKLYLIRI